MRILLILLLLSGVCYADDYVVVKNGKALGTVAIKDEALPEWEKDYEMIPASLEFVGKHHYELRYENNEVRLATEQEINDYYAQLEQEKENFEIQKLLSKLDKKEIQDKIKAIKKMP